MTFVNICAATAPLHYAHCFSGVLKVKSSMKYTVSQLPAGLHSWQNWTNYKWGYFMPDSWHKSEYTLLLYGVFPFQCWCNRVQHNFFNSVPFSTHALEQFDTSGSSGNSESYLNHDESNRGDRNRSWVAILPCWMPVEPPGKPGYQENCLLLPASAS